MQKYDNSVLILTLILDGENCRRNRDKGESLSFFISPIPPTLIKARLCKVSQFPHQELMKPLCPKLIGFFGFCSLSTLHLETNSGSHRRYDLRNLLYKGMPC